MKTFKKYNLLALIMIMLVVMIPCISGIAASNTNTTKGTAEIITPNKTYKYNYNGREGSIWYKVTLTEDGYFYMEFKKNEMESGYKYDIAYNVYADDVLLETGKWLGTEQAVTKFNTTKYGFPAGTEIYIEFSSNNIGYKDCYLTVYNVESKEWEIEENDSMENANSIEMNKTYYGMVDDSDDYDYFSSIMSQDGYIQLNFDKINDDFSGSDLYKYYVEIFVNDSQIYNFSYGESSIESLTTYKMPLAKGDKVYVRIWGDWNPRVEYKFKLIETSTNDWETENNDTEVSADVLNINEIKCGNFIIKDEVDWYKCTSSYSGEVTLMGGRQSIDSTGNTSYYVYVNGENVLSCKNISSVYGKLGTFDIEKGQTIVIKVVKYIGYYDTPYKLSLDLSTIDNTPNVKYTTHVQSYGWQDFVSNGVMAGTSGKAKRLESIKIEETGVDGLGIQYTTHCQSYGWLPWSADGQENGTTGEAKRLEAIKIQLTGANKDKYDVYYRVHAQSYGWLGWAKNGEASGTAGYAKRLEGIQVVILQKGSSAPGTTYADVTGSTTNKAYYAKDGNTPNVNGADDLNVKYRTHVQSFGWQPFVYNGKMSGTSGKAKRLEGIEISLTNTVNGGIQYKTHIQSYGWEKEWRSNGQMSGTNGQAKRLEAIQIQLTGEVAKQYDVYYRVHAQSYGWLGWAKNGESAGTAGYSKRLEGIQIVLVKKGGAVPSKYYDGITSNRTEAYIAK